MPVPEHQGRSPRISGKSGKQREKKGSQDEDDRLRQRMSVRLSVEEFWIGLGDLDGDGTYRWVRDDSEPGYLPWTAGSPDDPPPACVRSVSNTTPPGWRDRPCPDPFPYVCDGPG